MSKIAFLGLGAMGSRMAARLLGAGHHLTVWNRDPARAAAVARAGATLAGTPRAAAAGADVVFTMVTDDAAARQVWLDEAAGALHGLKPGAIAIESSTVTPAFVRELAARVAAREARFLDAPVAGSRPQAEAGQLVFMVGGEAGTVAAARPLLEVLGARVIPVGAAGQGAVLKLAVNTLFAAQLASLAELLGFLSRNGFAAGAAAELLAGFPIVAPPLAGAARMMATGETTPLFTIDLIEKDLGYIVATARASGAQVPGAESARAAFRHAQARGLGAMNVSGLAAVFA